MIGAHPDADDAVCSSTARTPFVDDVRDKWNASVVTRDGALAIPYLLPKPKGFEMKQFYIPFRSPHFATFLLLASTSLGCASQEPTAVDDGPSSKDEAALTCGALGSGENMFRGATLSSCNGAAALYFQSDGNLVWQDNVHGRIMWAPGTNGKGPSMLRMQLDGDLVVFHYDGATPIWHSNTAGNPGASLRVQDNGNLVIYAADGRNIWSTETTTDRFYCSKISCAQGGYVSLCSWDCSVGRSKSCVPNKCINAPDGRFVCFTDYGASPAYCE